MCCLWRGVVRSLCRGGEQAHIYIYIYIHNFDFDGLEEIMQMGSFSENHSDAIAI